MQRALHTCSVVFENHKSKPIIIVEPYFRTILEATNDIGSKIEESQQMFPSFDFNRVKDKEAWYIHTLYEKDRTHILKEI